MQLPRDEPEEGSCQQQRAQDFPQLILHGARLSGNSAANLGRLNR